MGGTTENIAGKLETLGLDLMSGELSYLQSGRGRPGTQPQLPHLQAVDRIPTSCEDEES